MTFHKSSIQLQHHPYHHWTEMEVYKIFRCLLKILRRVFDIFESNPVDRARYFLALEFLFCGIVIVAQYSGFVIFSAN